MNDSVIVHGNTSVALNPAPIYPDWILEGSPVARAQLLSSSADGTAHTLIWDCTAGRFNWFYSIDETVCVLEGSVTIKDAAGRSRRASAGDTIFFPAGSHAEWTVDNYIRKIAFCRTALPLPIVLALRLRRRLKRLIGGGTKGDGAPGMFNTGT